MNEALEIKVNELSDKYEIHRFVLKEVLGGEIAHGELGIYTNQDNISTDIYELHFTLSDQSGYKMAFQAYAYEVIYHKVSLEIKFICASPEFIKNNVVKSHKSVIQAINANWTGDIDYKSNADINCDIHQRSETGYQLVSKLIKSLRYKSAYGFRCNEIVIRDLDDNYDHDLGRQEFPVQTQPLVISKSKVRELNPISEEIGVTLSISYSKVFRQVRSEYAELMRNYFVNNSLTKIMGSYKLSVKYTRFETKLKIGQVIKCILKDLSVSKFLIFSKTLTWSRATGVITEFEFVGYDW